MSYYRQLAHLGELPDIPHQPSRSAHTLVSLYVSVTTNPSDLHHTFDVLACLISNVAVGCTCIAGSHDTT